MSEHRYLTRTNGATNGFYKEHDDKGMALTYAAGVKECPECSRDIEGGFMIMVEPALAGFNWTYVTAYCWKCIPKIMRRVDKARAE
jgi:hypothetical protein